MARAALMLYWGGSWRFALLDLRGFYQCFSFTIENIIYFCHDRFIGFNGITLILIDCSLPIFKEQNTAYTQ